MRVPGSTLEDVATSEPRDAALWIRRGFLLLLATFLAVGLSGELGVRTTTTSATGGGYDLSVRHAAVARAGLDVPWQVTVRSPGGFDKTLVLAVTGNYFDIFETQGFTPEPAAWTRDGTTVYLTFDTPDADTFRLDYDAYIQPASQRGQDGTVSVVVGGVPVVTVEFETKLWP